MLRSLKLIALLAIPLLLFSGIAMAQDDGLKLTGWPYEVDVVTENLGRFTDQTGHGAVFLPFPSNEYRDKMVASFVAGTEFDVAYVRDSYLAEWASAGWILPITGLEGADELLADLPAGIIEQMSYDGEVYGLPYYSGVQTMAYNAAHLETAGIDAPPETWDEMLEQAQMIKDAGVVDYPILMQLRSGENYLLREWETLTASRGGRLFDEDFNPLFHMEGSAAWQLVQFLGGKDATGEYYVPKRWALEFGLGFSPAPLYEDEDVRNSLSGWIDPDLLSEQSEYAISRPYRFVPFFSDWEISSWGPLQAAILGDADKGQVLADLAEEWNELKEDWGY